jgi:hypothetical protein
MAFTTKGVKKQAETEIPTPEVSPSTPSAEEFELLTPEEQARLAQIHFAAEEERLVKESQERLAKKDRSNQILVHITIDPHEGPLATKIHKWVDITPSLCTEPDCGYDAAVKVGYKGGWKAIPEGLDFDSKRTMQEFVLETLARHRAAVHPVATPKHIRTKEQAEKQRKAKANQLPEGFVVNPSLT